MVGIVAQHPSQSRDALAEAVLLDDHARPECAEQLLFVEKLAGALDEKKSSAS
jgi:hypothetical protein